MHNTCQYPGGQLLFPFFLMCFSQQWAPISFCFLLTMQEVVVYLQLSLEPNFDDALQHCFRSIDPRKKCTIVLPDGQFDVHYAFDIPQRVHLKGNDATTIHFNLQFYYGVYMHAMSSFSGCTVELTHCDCNCFISTDNPDEITFDCRVVNKSPHLPLTSF